MSTFTCPVVLTPARVLTYPDRYPSSGWCSECDGLHSGEDPPDPE